MYRSNSLWKSSNYRNAIQLNLKMFLCAWWTIFSCYHKRHNIIENLFQKLNISKTEHTSSEMWDCQWHKTFTLKPVFTTLIWLLLLYKNVNVVVLLLLIFLLVTTIALATSWVTFLQTRIIVCFSDFLIWFSHTSLMEINSTHVYFRSRIILCFHDEKQIKTYSKTQASQNIVCINAIV